MASFIKFWAMPASTPRRRMKASIALLRPPALLRIHALLLRDGLGKPLLVDQIEVAADAAQVANGRADRGFQGSVILDNNVGPDVDLARRMRELHRAPRRLKPPR